MSRVPAQPAVSFRRGVRPLEAACSASSRSFFPLLCVVLSQRKTDRRARAASRLSASWRDGRGSSRPWWGRCVPTACDPGEVALALGCRPVSTTGKVAFRPGGMCVTCWVCSQCWGSFLGVGGGGGEGGRGSTGLRPALRRPRAPRPARVSARSTCPWRTLHVPPSRDTCAALM